MIGDGRTGGGSPFGNGNDRLVAVGYLGHVAASLQAAAVTLVDLENPYAAAALVRQLVEVEYLLWAFADNHDDAARWLAATPSERRKMWQPGHLRKRSGDRFRGLDYWLHCDYGGHPTPEGVRLLIDPASLYPGEAMLCESLIHTAAAWRSLTTIQAGPDDGQVVAALDDWRDRDPLASGLESRTELVTRRPPS